MLLQFAIKTFDLVLALTVGGPGIATTLPAIFVYDLMFQRGQIAEGAAAAIMILLALSACSSPTRSGRSGGAAGRRRMASAAAHTIPFARRRGRGGASPRTGDRLPVLVALRALIYLLPFVVIVLNSFRDLQEIAASA